MRILITGSTGFIGGAFVDALLARGHQVVACVHRTPIANPNPHLSQLRVDYRQDLSAADWVQRLQGIDAVINAVGILRETPHAQFDALHHRAPAALFAACEDAGVDRVIQVSALGADMHARSAYHCSKRAADDALRASSLRWSIIQPSLVFGQQGDSTQLFCTLASLPITPLVGRGDQQIQPIHIDDLCAMTVRLLEQALGVGQTIAAVGPRALSLRSLLQNLRSGMALPTTWQLPIPLAFIKPVAWLGDLTKRGALSSETLGMLTRGNTADVSDIRTLLGHLPLDPIAFIPPVEAKAWRLDSVYRWLAPMMSVVLATLWISAGIVSWLYAQAQGVSLLSALGIPDALVQPSFAAACLLNISFGVLSLIAPSRLLWLGQLILVVIYTLGLSVVATQLWLDPLGPLVKNLPIVAILIGLIGVNQAA